MHISEHIVNHVQLKCRKSYGNIEKRNWSYAHAHESHNIYNLYEHM